MRKKIFITILITTIISCSKKPGTLVGNVYWKYNDYVGNKPDAGCEVKLYSLTENKIDFKTTTDVSGNYKIDDIVPGKYFLIIKSKNTTDSPKDHLDNLLIYSQDLKKIFGLDINKFKTEIEEVNSLENKYREALIASSDQKSYEGISKQMEVYHNLESQIMEKSADIISKFPAEFKTTVGLYTGYDKSFSFKVIEIKEAKTTTENVDFGLTYN